MKLSKIASVIKERKTLILYDNENANKQWVGDGGCIYPLDGLPYVDEESLCNMFDIDSKKQSKMHIEHRPANEFIDVLADIHDDDEEEATEYPTLISFGQYTYIPIETNEGLFFVRKRYMDPLEKKNKTTYHLRRYIDDKFVIAAKQGFILKVVIFPVAITQKKTLEMLKDIYKNSYDTAKKYEYLEDDLQMKLED